MNIHVSQSIQTVSELRLIANAAKRFVSPATSKIVYTAVQDTAMGSFLLTYPEIRIDWKDAMNILMATSVGLNGKIPKQKKLLGKFLYSQIIPKEINIIRKKDNGDYLMRIINGMMMDGIYSKSEVGAIIQKTWFQYGSKESTHFIDDLQRMILQWLMRYGFTVGIKDIIVPPRVHKCVKEIVEAKRKEILNIITEYQNDPYIMTAEAHETSIQANLQAVQENIEKTVVNSFSNDGGVFITISSGSSGTTLNTGQIIGAIGQVIVEQKKNSKKIQ